MGEALARAFERGLWLVRFLMLVPIVASVLLALSATYLATIDALHVLGQLSTYTTVVTGGAVSHGLRSALVSDIMRAVDLYLIAAVLIIFALGLYELFIRRLQVVENSEFASRLLAIRSLDDLKNRLSKVVLIVLIIEFLQQSLGLTYRTPLDILYLAIGIALVGLALYLTGIGSKG